MEKIIIDDLLKCLNDSCPYIDFSTSKKFLSDKVLDSVEFVAMVSGLEEKYHILIEPEDMTIENFDNIEKIFAYLKKR